MRDVLCRAAFPSVESEIARSAYEAERKATAKHEFRDADLHDLGCEWAANIAATAAAKINFFIWDPFKVALPIVYGGKGFGANSVEFSI